MKIKTYPDRISDWFSDRFSSYYWHGDREKKKVYLTFDDGPTPIVTDFVLKELTKFDFKATFFCIGDKVEQFPRTYNQLLEQGHAIGNHTQHHLNAWKTSSIKYMEDVEKCAQQVNSQLFRPPYGRITGSLTKSLVDKGYKIVLWDLLSGDFDQRRTAASCLENLKTNTRNGSVIVFHDSDKSYKMLQEILPQYLEFLKDQGWKSDSITAD
ncbi:peptidoglycan/xylan/chitin deacetylase (PgdA/CDA1 family) [Nonlabens dokdonensis]|uniref:Peptidoglycan/xylan/chitin deacetylase (PgdA/CDA1 family) n=2 Tax=Nonlabens dokdonensis TaxID=328515 RepID=A0ABX5PTW5_9FLAO|nr:polysaccharide deacetylase family protein [Nonlabens dokdonensis]AGC76866.1 putative polysaccharide deacetylase [Nonlabens dokdonensis DSW-6]PZX36774.1 peptidoglycan/xylan/chitin deacetylase (PgdA/CDA1 family) [Nonlabens dokdonensis]